MQTSGDQRREIAKLYPPVIASAAKATGNLPHYDHAHVEGVDIEEPGIGAAEVTR